MFWRIFGKVAFKALASLVIMVAVMSWVVSSNGGDPGKLLGGVLRGAADNIAGDVREAGQDAGRTLRSLNDTPAERTERNTVYSWIDESGTTHFGSAPPAGVEARAIRVSSANSSAPTPKPSGERGMLEENNTTLDGERLPGIAGSMLPSVIEPEALGIDREAVIRQIYGNRLSLD